jgi:hypothetical protein
MIKNKRIWKKFEVEILKKEKIDYKDNFRIFDDLYKLAKSLNKFQFEPLEDIEYDIKYAFAINGIRKKWKQKNF